MQKIKAAEDTRHIPVLLVTSHEAASSLKAEGLDAGADDFLCRPIDNDEWVARVKVALRISRAENQLRSTANEAKHEYQRLFDRMIDGVAVHEMIFDGRGAPVDYRFLSVNPAFEEHTGLRAEDIVGKTVREVLPGLDPAWIERYGRVVGTGEPERFEQYSAPLDRHFDVSAFLTGENQFATVIFDFTERKRVEEAIAVSEARFRSYTEYAPFGIFVADQSGRYIDVNRAAERITGYSRAELLTICIPDVLPDDQKGAGQQHFQTLIETGKSVGEIAFRTKSGEIRWWRISAVRLSEDRYLGFTEDITGSKKNREALRESEEKLRIIVENSTNMFYSHTPEHVLTYMSPQVKEILGYEEEEALVRWTEMASDDPVNEKGFELTEKAIKTGQAQPTYELQLIHKDGHPVWAEVRETPLVEDGKTVAIVGSLTDITERKRAEAYREMGREILQILNEPGELQESIRRVLDVLKTRTGADAVGLRLEEGEDFPYFAEDGFPPDFLQTENTLVDRSKDGGVCRDKDGNICLACTCGLVISGKADPSNSLFTPGGSFWTNDAFPLLDLPSDQDPRLHARNNCIHQGYASVALIPVRTKDRIVGLIQLNDKRKDRFTLETIEILESIAAHIGSALMRKRVDQALRESREELDAMWNTMDVGIALVDAETRHILSVNPALLQISGYTEDELVGHVCHDVICTAGRDACPVADLHQAVDHCDRELKHKEGRLVPIEKTVTPIELKGREVYVETIVDIEKIKQAEGELRRLSTAIEQSPEAVVITDIEGTIQYVNPGFEVITGYTREEAIGQNPRMLQSDKQDAEFYNDLWATLLRGDTWGGRFVNKRKDGSLYTEEATLSPVRDSNGTITNYVGVKRDISEDIKMAEQLHQSQKMESVGRLAGGVAHDFNNMLMGIMGYTDMCRDKVGDDHPVNEWLEEIKKASQRSANLTRQLLAFARKQTVTPKVMDLNEGIEGMLKMLRHLIGEDIDLAWQACSEPTTVKMDPGQIDQILANLCVNARDAIGDVGKITMETRRVAIDAAYGVEHIEAEPGDYIMLAVSDDGCGMDSEALEHIFEPFYTTKGVGEGTGLGLSTIYGIVKQNDGFVNVCSEPGNGTTFRIYLPRHAARAAETTAARVQAAERGSETILLVEDEPAILKMTTIMLEQSGYKVLAAGTPGAAIALAREYLAACGDAQAGTGEIHLLITDVIMPEMNGRDLAKKLFSLYPDLKQLFMSGYTTHVIDNQGVWDEGVNFIQKPFSKRDLTVKIREALE